MTPRQDGPRLVVAQQDPISLDGTTVRIATKSLVGLEQYARTWPGEVVLLARATDRAATVTPLHTAVARGELPFDLELREGSAPSRAREGAAATLAFHHLDAAALLARDPRSVVLFGEFSLAERIRIGALDAPSVTRARVAAGWLRRRGALRRMVRDTGGYQANGYPALSAYGALSPRAMLYLDTRMTATLFARGRDHLAPGDPSPGHPLRLGFSGRHIRAKGAEDAVSAAVRAATRGLALTLDVFGSGEATARMRAIAAPLGDRARFHGDLVFDDAWVRAVAAGIDLMVLPHRQGDPAGTYLETAALGVPVLGYANRALQALVDRHGIGWTVPMDDVDALAAAIAGIGRDPAGRAAAGAAGRELMSEHLFAREAERRIAHLREVAQV